MRSRLQKTFEEANWGNDNGVPRSGSGSTHEYTARLRAAFPDIFARYRVKTFLDAPCGDWNWMSAVDLTGIKYIGGDISASLIADNSTKYASKTVSFQHLDITDDALPKADLLMVRDCLFHLKFWLRWAFFENFAKSKIPYLMVTMHHQEVNNPLGVNGRFKRFNPRAAPFHFEEPLEMIHETVDSLPEDLTPTFLRCGQWESGRAIRSSAD